MHDDLMIEKLIHREDADAVLRRRSAIPSNNDNSNSREDLNGEEPK